MVQRAVNHYLRHYIDQVLKTRAVLYCSKRRNAIGGLGPVYKHCFGP